MVLEKLKNAIVPVCALLVVAFLTTSCASPSDKDIISTVKNAYGYTSSEYIVKVLSVVPTAKLKERVVQAQSLYDHIATVEVSSVSGGLRKTVQVGRFEDSKQWTLTSDQLDKDVGTLIQYRNILKGAN